MKFGLILVTVIGLLVSGCNEQSEQIVSAPLYISTISVEQPIKSQHRTFKGQVVPAEQTMISFRRAGEIQQVMVKTGDVVTKGQLIARLDASKAQQVFNDTEAQLRLATRQLKRGKELHRNNMMSKAELDELTANKALAQANFASASNQLGYTNLYAPVTGKVSELYKERFERTGIAEPVLSLYQNDKVYVRIDLSDNVLAMVNPNAKNIDYRPIANFSGVDQAYPVSYLEHSSEPDSQTQTYQMYLSMPQPAQEILPGTSVNVNVDMVRAGIASIDGYKIPMTALQAGDTYGEFFVWKINSSLVSKVAVNIEQVNGQGVVVSSGVAQGDVLANSSLRKLRDGMRVDIKGKLK